MKQTPPDRRQFIARGLAGIGALSLAGCDRLSESTGFMNVLSSAENLSRSVQRLLVGNALAPEFTEADLSPAFKANGTIDPQDDDYRALARRGFARWKLSVEGLVERPLQFSLAELRALPSRTQITRHDCVEGWSCIGKWRGVPLSVLLERAGVKPQAKYVVFHCADDMNAGQDQMSAPDSDDAESDDSGDTASDNGKAAEPGTEKEAGNATGEAEANESNVARYYESLDFVDALHPQTILAYDMNDKPLPIAYGAPIRLRVERQLGYKMAKYVMRIELVESFAQIGKGKGGYWEDQGYEWYAGI